MPLSVRNKYLLTYCFAGIPLTIFFPGRQIVYIVTFAIILFYFLSYNKNLFPRYFFRYMVLINAVILLQTLVFNRFDFIAYVGMLMYPFYAFFIISLIGHKTYYYYVQILYVIAIISFIFYFPSLFSESIHESIGKIAPFLGTDKLLLDQNFIIYTWERRSSLGLLRNSGNFTEPGSFAAYLILALIFNIIHTNKIIEKKNIIFFIALITTFSTAGYMALFILLSGYYLSKRKKRQQLIITPLILLIGFYTYHNLSFLEEKVEKQYTATIESGSSGGRFGSGYYDLLDLKKHPFTGRGMLPTTRFDNITSWEGDQAPRSLSNGLTSQLLRFGVIGFAFYLMFLYYSLNRYVLFHGFNLRYTLVVIATVFTVAFGQSVLNNAPFVGLLFIGYQIPKKLLNENINSNAKL